MPNVYLGFCSQSHYGCSYQIDQLKYKCRAASSKVSGGGIRYTVIIHGKETFLFSEGNKWFVEAKGASQ